MKNSMQHFKLTHLTFIITALLLGACNNSNDKNESMPMANKAPTASDVMVTTQTEVAIEDMLQGSDPEGDSLSFVLVTEPMLGMVVVNTDGSYTYIPNLEVTGMDSFEYGVSDGVNPQVTAMVDITIEALEVDFAQLARDVFHQAPNDKPLSINGRVFTNIDTNATFDDLLTDN